MCSWRVYNCLELIKISHAQSLRVRKRAPTMQRPHGSLPLLSLCRVQRSVHIRFVDACAVLITRNYLIHL